jgi:valyl-tRNA synthetase
MDLRPQGPEIIRTWLFDTVLRAHLEHDVLPWSDTTINGWILDPDRKKMSKSKGNTVTPMALLEQYGSDAVRYWAVSARPGVDTAFDEGQMKIGRRLAIKILNASKFALGVGEELDAGAVVEALDRSMLAGLHEVVDAATRSFDEYDYARALEVTERFFWSFCDDYLELVKGRAYGSMGDEAARSARAALLIALDVLLRLFAPHLPFVTEEVWSWRHDGSVHRTGWPTTDELGIASVDTRVYEVTAAVLSEIRKAKSAAQRSMRADVARVGVEAPEDLVGALGLGLADLREAGNVSGDIDVSNAYELAVEVELADPEAA